MRRRTSPGGRLVVADASPLIGLAAAGAFELLRELFGTVTITSLVKDEVLRRPDRPGGRELEGALRAGWVRVAAAPLETWQFAELDAGEASTLALAQQQERALVLIDDVRGRERASSLALDTLDLAGVLSAAKRAALIDAVQPFMARLARRGFTLSDEARGRLLAEAGEPAAASGTRRR